MVENLKEKISRYFMPVLFVSSIIASGLLLGQGVLHERDIRDRRALYEQKIKGLEEKLKKSEERARVAEADNDAILHRMFIINLNYNLENPRERAHALDGLNSSWYELLKGKGIPGFPGSMDFMEGVTGRDDLWKSSLEYDINGFDRENPELDVLRSNGNLGDLFYISEK